MNCLCFNVNTFGIPMCAQLPVTHNLWEGPEDDRITVETCSPNIISENKCCADVKNWYIYMSQHFVMPLYKKWLGLVLPYFTLVWFWYGMQLSLPSENLFSGFSSVTELYIAVPQFPVCFCSENKTEIINLSQIFDVPTVVLLKKIHVCWDTGCIDRLKKLPTSSCTAWLWRRRHYDSSAAVPTCQSTQRNIPHSLNLHSSAF